MNNETFLDFCFIREHTGGLGDQVNKMFDKLFSSQRRMNWYLDEKVEMGAEIVVAEVKGMSNWTSEQAVIDYLEENAEEDFWELLQGYQFNVYPAMRGCSSCG